MLSINEQIFNIEFVYIILFLSSLFYLIGLIDDIKNLSPNLKLFLVCSSFLIVAFLFPEIKLVYIKISFLEKTYYFNNFSVVFLLFSFALLTNALNMFDGINMQLIIYSIFIFFIFVLKGFFSYFFISIIICLIFLSILNYKNKIFLGDSGGYLLSSIIGCTFIYQYKFFDNFLYGDEIFIILLIPSIDMLRLFLVRLIKKKSPFKGDLNHLHHIVNSYIRNDNLTIICTLFLSALPSLMLLFEFKTYYIFVINIIIYSLVITYLKKKL